MAKNKKFTVKHKRRRQGRTDYKLRFGLIKSGKTRIVIRKSLNNTSIQFVDYIVNGDKVLVSSHTKELAKDLLLKEKEIEVCIVYLFFPYGSLYA